MPRAPNTDPGRDPRWGRTEECYGEDPFLVGTLATAFIEGLQGDDPRYWKAAALLKHFLANSNEDGRESSSSNFDERLWREYYSVPFRMGFEGGGARAFMAAYNALNGIPLPAHPMLKTWSWPNGTSTASSAPTGEPSASGHATTNTFPDLPEAAAAASTPASTSFSTTTRNR